MDALDFDVEHTLPRECRKHELLIYRSRQRATELNGESSGGS